MKKSVKLDLMRVSMLIVMVSEATELFNLRALLDTALPKLAGLHLFVFTLGIEKKKV